MNIVFYITAAVAVFATLRVVTNTNAVHALLYLIVSLLAVAVIFYLLGAPFAAALEVIIYAGAILVLFVFVIMMLNLSREAVRRERLWLDWKIWPGPVALGLILVGELAYVVMLGKGEAMSPGLVGAREVGVALFGPYMLSVELAGMLLLGGLVGAFHLARKEEPADHR